MPRSQPPSSSTAVPSPPPSTDPSASPPRPSLLHRLRSKTSSITSLRPSRRSLAAFDIKLQDPHRVFSPTDIVRGSVCLTVERTLAVTHLVVNLVGRIDVYASGREGSGGRRKERTESEMGVVVCRDEAVLCGEGRLEPGRIYEFRFELEFNRAKASKGHSLPTSLDFGRGSISYHIISTLTRPTTSNPIMTHSTKISFMETIDIAHLPAIKPQVVSLKAHRATRVPRSRSPDQKATSASSSPCSSDRTSYTPSPTPSIVDKSTPITATVELMKAGVLRGDTIPVRVSIQHRKHIKSLNGIILTLHRQTRFDPQGEYDKPFKKALNPALPISSIFRKDLAQTIYPLIVDPLTKTAVIKANLRVPEDAFPTIRNVPGSLVEFRYYVEVVMDLGGKLNGREDIFSNVVPGLPRPATGIEADFSGAGGGISVEGGVMIETEKVRRREKSVVACRFEVVVGSVDSVGRKGKRGGLAAATAAAAAATMSAPPSMVPERDDQQTSRVEAERTPSQFDRNASPSQSSSYPSSHGEAPEYEAAATDQEYWRVPPVPLPPIQGQVDEKTRQRLHEESLLPSEPPGVETESAPEASSSSVIPAPSAPPLEQHPYSDYRLSPSMPGPSTAPLNDDDASCDKAEAERQRLALRESGPEDDIVGQPSGAPVLGEEVVDQLPLYER